MKKILILLSLITFLAFGCNTTRPGLGSSTEKAPAPFTEDTLKNANYRFEVRELTDVYNKDSFKLTNGKYYFALPQGATREDGGYLTQLDMDEKLVIRPNSYTFGDIDNDGQADAAVILTSMAGKNRIYHTLAVLLNKKGDAENVAGVQLDFGAGVESISIKDGKIGLVEKFANSNEVKNLTFRLNGTELVKE